MIWMFASYFGGIVTGAVVLGLALWAASKALDRALGGHK